MSQARPQLTGLFLSERGSGPGLTKAPCGEAGPGLQAAALGKRERAAYWRADVSLALL